MNLPCLFMKMKKNCKLLSSLFNKLIIINHTTGRQQRSLMKYYAPHRQNLHRNPKE